MAKKKELSIEDKLRALYDLQLIDSRIDEIRNVRGELPLEVQDLEDEIAGLDTRLEKINGEVADLEQEINDKKNTIKEANELKKKYEEQQKNVRNNREFDSLTKEIEYQDLEIQLAEKRIKEFKVKIAHKQELIEKTNEKKEGLTTHLGHKKAELDDIMKETQEEENLLMKKSEEFAGGLDEHLFVAYRRIRNNVKNGLAVVSIERGASGGSFFTIPPQRQLEIASRKKIIIDEHSGRILVDAALAEEEKEKMQKLFS
ncbi:MAG: zinc ribbon domain-containing protein [Flavobacteriaceae bacterium]